MKQILIVLVFLISLNSFSQNDTIVFIEKTGKDLKYIESGDDIIPVLSAEQIESLKKAFTKRNPPIEGFRVIDKETRQCYIWSSKTKTWQAYEN